MEGELIAVEQSTAHNSLNLIKDDETLRKENTQAGLVVKQVLHNKPNPVMVNNKRHLEFEDWIALGNAYGITVKTSAEPVEIFDHKGFKGHADVIRVSDGAIIGGAESYCLDDEELWQNRALFQMSSMAQTRAGSKALSNELRGVVALDKTLNGTPGEEMVNKPKNKPKTVKPKTNGKSKAPKKTAPKKKAPKPKIDDEAIEVEATEVEEHDMSGDKPSMSLKEIIDSDKNIRLAVDEIQAQNGTPNRDNIKAKLLDFVEMGQITSENYKKAKELLE